MLKQVLTSRYQLIQPLVTGGFSQTYIAKDTHLPGHPRCVVKKLQPTLIDPNSLELARRLFKTEAETLQKVGKHPQIPSLLAYFEEDREFYLVQDFIRGITLEDALPLGTHLSESQVIALVQDCLGILQFVHSQGVIHRDIKPANLMHRQEDGKMVLLDFGAVKQLRLGQSHIVAPTIAIGTAGYTPDEQLRGRPNFTSDLYALGMIGIQALTGLSPDRLERDDHDEIDWQSHVTVSPPLAEILSKMVRRDYRQRYQSATELLAILRDIQGGPEAGRIDLNIEPQLEVTPQGEHDLGARAEVVRMTLMKLLGEQFDSDETLIQTDHTTRHDLPAVKTQTLESELLGQGPIPSSNKSLVPLATPIMGGPVGCPAAQTAGPGNTTGQLHFRWLKSAHVVAVSLILLLSGTTVGVLNLNKRAALAKTIDRLQNLYDQAKYSECIDQAEGAIANRQIPNGPIVELLTQCQLGEAQAKADQSSFADAIQIASQIPPDSIDYNQARQNIEVWSAKILNYATNIYEKQGKLSAALAVIKQIPQTSPVSQEAAKRSQQWQENHKINTALIEEAEIALGKDQAEKAIAKAEQVKGPQYLKQKSDKILQKAKQQIASRPLPAPVREWQPAPAPPRFYRAYTPPTRSVPAPQPPAYRTYNPSPTPPRYPRYDPPAQPVPQRQAPAAVPAPPKTVVQICPGPLCVE